MIIDVNTDFTLDTPGFWDCFWQDDECRGTGGNDPDLRSKTLQRYHQVIWSRELPCGETMTLERGTGPDYLCWKQFRFGSDSILTSFRYAGYDVIKDVKKAVPDYQAYIASYLHKAYTIGGEMIFPKHAGSINQMRGTNRRIRDRWDLTLECIRRFYQGEDSPISKALMRDKDFFDLFVDFKGFVDYFFFQDCVTEDYSSIKFWLGDGSLSTDPLPQNVDEYFCWMESQKRFLDKRNRRIQEMF